MSHLRILALGLVLTLAGCSSGASPAAEKALPESATPDQSTPDKPNILFILTDDQMPSTIEHMPNVKALASEGRVFTNTVNVYPLCCPSRATIQRGQYPHNHGIVTNGPPSGGYPRFRANGLHTSTVATWLDGAGYETAYFGKYMNFTPSGADPPGWDIFRAHAKAKGGQRVTGTGKIVSGPERDVDTSQRAKGFLGRSHEEPFFAFVGFDAPHPPYHHPKRYDKLFEDVKTPRTPDFNEKRIGDKPEWAKGHKRFLPKEVRAIDEEYRDALRSLVVVDKFVGSAVELLRDAGEMDNTYVFFYTDNGVHTGYHRLPYGKKTPYETDIGFPLVVKGPGVQAGEQASLVGSHDIAPTLAEIARAQVPDFVDGRSMVPLFSGEDGPWRSAIYVENATSEDAPGSFNSPPPWEAMRTEKMRYVEWGNGDRELNDLEADPYELKNIYSSLSDKRKADLRSRLEALKDCSGEQCRLAENP